MKQILFIFFCIICKTICCQNVNWVSPINFNTTNRIYSNHLDANEEGISLNFTLEYDDTLHYRNLDLLIPKNQYNNNETIRLDTNGEFLWHRSFTGENFCVKVHKKYTYVSGIFILKQIIDLDTILINRCAAFIIKLDENGKTVWYKISNEFYYTDEFNLIKIEVDDNENVFLFAGNNIRKSISFDSIPINLVNYDSLVQANYIVKFDKSGKSTGVFGFSPRCVANQNGRIIDAKVINNEIYILTGAKIGYSYNLFCDTFWFYSNLYKYNPISNELTSLIEFKSTNSILLNGFDIDEQLNKIIFGSYNGSLYINGRVVNDSIHTDCQGYNPIFTLFDKDNIPIWNQNIYSQSAYFNQNKSIISISNDINASQIINFFNIKGELFDSFKFSINRDNSKYANNDLSSRFNVSKSNIYYFDNYFEMFVENQSYQIPNLYVHFLPNLILMKLGNKFLYSNNEPSFSCKDFNYSYIDNEIIIPNYDNDKIESSLYSIEGKKIGSILENSQMFNHYNLNEYSTGIYIVKLTKNNQTCTLKILKE